MRNWVEMTSSWLFLYAKCKYIISFSFFALTYALLLKEEKRQRYLQNNKFFQMFLKCKTLSRSYRKLRHKRTQNGLE
jgi:hypothetical protein